MELRKEVNYSNPDALFHTFKWEGTDSLAGLSFVDQGYYLKGSLLLCTLLNFSYISGRQHIFGMWSRTRWNREELWGQPARRLDKETK